MRGWGQQRIVRLMAESPVLEAAGTATVSRLAGSGTLRRYRRGTYLFHEGDGSLEVFFLLQGRVEISGDSGGGRRRYHTTLEGSRFFGELGVLGDQPRTASALALEDSDLWVIAGEDFRAFVSEEAAVSRAMLRILARQVHAHEAFVEDLLDLDLKGRVAKRLLQLVSPSLEELPEDGVRLPSTVTHADLAGLCGGSRENVTRIVSELQRRGLIEREGRRLVLRRIAELAKIAGIER
jgi:CRP/FNR family cyclic AMP-dependent transcriptional regulator